MAEVPVRGGADVAPQVQPPAPSSEGLPQPPEPKVKAQAQKGIAVVATDIGFYGNARRAVGDKFTIESEKQFSKIWMKKI